MPFHQIAYALPVGDYRTLHDHRDNFAGGFAYAVFHSGTGIPQQPLAI